MAPITKKYKKLNELTQLKSKKRGLKVMENGEYYSLFETSRDRGRMIRRVYAISLFVAVCFIWAYRLSHIPSNGEHGKWAWFGLFASDMWFGLYWLFGQALRWNLVFRKPFTNILSQRYESSLPGVDIFVFTADPIIEPPMMVINTVLSVMAYDYPVEKLNVYLSDDAGSDITFYALLEASIFAKHWVPFCKRFNVEPRSPHAYFNTLVSTNSHDHKHAKDLIAIKKLYEDMKRRIEDAVKLGEVPSRVRSKHKGFSQWDSYSSRHDHDTIIQILLHKRDLHNSKDVDGFVLPTLVYMAREKRPQHHHNYKAGAMNSLLRVSSTISNAKIILILDCDMYSNHSQSIRDALCFLMDEERGQEIAFVQFPQNFENIRKNDLYVNALSIIMEVELHGADGYGGPLFIGTCCFHRRDSLCGKKLNGQYKNDWNDENEVIKANLHELEEESKALARCTYEENTLWGKEIGAIYGSLVEDVITGLWIHLQGWKSVYYNPPRKAFLGIAPTTLLDTLVQQKRWAEGELQILFSKYSPTWYGHGKINLGLIMGYCHYNYWAFTCLPILYYSIIPSLYLLKGISLFPKMSSPWFKPFAYVIFGETTSSLIFGGTIQGWWNGLRMWLYMGTSSYIFALIDIVLKLFGHSNSSFTVTTKIIQDDVSKRYEKEIMEFGTSSPYFTILATLALLNLFCLLATLKELVLGQGALVGEKMTFQVLLCGFLVLINFPLYQGIFLRKDNGRLPISLAIKSIVLALSACILFRILN